MRETDSYGPGSPVSLRVLELMDPEDVLPANRILTTSVYGPGAVDAAIIEIQKRLASLRESTEPGE